ncbi:hypothetical protein CVM73_08615 [Bradyrhizobium forestalis]|uniref:Uncharacterized protein n=1 Tax=Bradyrhizobium forestalis TaxID=1419263 RepID=A0A2M8RCS2_9BRAD|nr:hypothetical protein CVM73_08615 [Bradyrhizobium forestalis]
MSAILLRALRPSFETPALGGLLRMRTECAAAVQFQRAPTPISLILRDRAAVVSRDEACAQAAAESQMR